ncbi:cell division protein ZipA [Gammaproteobacteria bacterium]|nr:cell division protein ZipA [Gammaproteobacteria bacterium]MDB4059564.1 cell division protein ZipA [Gammaproteobacteria bacterium]|tara:strand:+ start:3796 stop:4413 length:618 start_codon:yes stop_codon:yes gene_type:complete
MQANSDIYLIGLSVIVFLIITFFFLKKVASSNDLKVKIEEIPEIYNDEIPNERTSQSSFNFIEKSKKENYEQELIIFNLISIDGSHYDMDQLFGFVHSYKSKLIDGYFSFLNNNKEIFRIANALKPGTFETETQSHAILIVADLNDVPDATLTVKLMLDFATQFSENFHASICDANRLPLTKQMISHIQSTAQEASRLKRVSDFA